jgi:hypothetical protein
MKVRKMLCYVKCKVHIILKIEILHYNEIDNFHTIIYLENFI